jgi:hypothetical protein
VHAFPQYLQLVTNRGAHDVNAWLHPCSRPRRNPRPHRMRKVNAGLCARAHAVAAGRSSYRLTSLINCAGSVHSQAACACLAPAHLGTLPPSPPPMTHRCCMRSFQAITRPDNADGDPGVHSCKARACYLAAAVCTNTHAKRWAAAFAWPCIRLCHSKHARDKCNPCRRVVACRGRPPPPFTAPPFACTPPVVNITLPHSPAPSSSLGSAHLLAVG